MRWGRCGTRIPSYCKSGLVRSCAVARRSVRGVSAAPQAHYPHFLKASWPADTFLIVFSGMCRFKGDRVQILLNQRVAKRALVFFLKISEAHNQISSQDRCSCFGVWQEQRCQLQRKKWSQKIYKNWSQLDCWKVKDGSIMENFQPWIRSKYNRLEWFESFILHC